MPDEALKASLQGRPRQAPDFSPLALSHLHASCLAVRQLIKQYLTAPSKAQLESLSTAVKEIHHTLQLLDRQGAVLVTTELSLLLDAMRAGVVNDSDACAHSLVFAGERLADYVAHLQRPGAVDSALPLLPVINNCRACRGEELLSEMLVVASGIDLPDASNLPLPSKDHIAAFTQRIQESHQPLMSGLVGWFTDKSSLQTSLNDLANVFAKLSESCDAPTSLQPMVPLFDSAEFICESVRLGGLDSSAALHRLFAQLERLLDSYGKLNANEPAAFTKPVPERLFLNMLYYVALSSETSSKAVALRRRFRLDRFISRGMATDRSQVVFDGVGDRLADSIRDAIEMETEAARAWLGDPNRSNEDRDRVSERLAQLEPAIMLLGAPEARRQLALVNASLASLSNADANADANPDSDPEQTAEHIADALVRLERALDTELNALRVRSSSSEHSDLESILAACLSEAQLRLLEIENELVVLFGQTDNKLGEQVADQDSSRDTDEQHKQQQTITVAQVNVRLSMINSALQVLPLPEVSPLISGIQSFIARHENRKLSHSARRDLATVMVSLGYYLNSVLQPNGAAGQLLLEAEEALLNLGLEGLEENDDTLAVSDVDVTGLLDNGEVGYRDQPNFNTIHDVTIVDLTLDTEAENFIDVSLQQMGVINNTLFEYEQAGLENQADLRSAQRTQLIAAYEIIERETSVTQSSDLAELAQANIRLLKSGNDSKDAQTLMEESVAVLPQLINQMHSSSDKVFGLQALLDRLHDAAIEDITMAMDVQSILAQSSTTEHADTVLIEEGTDIASGLDDSVSTTAFDNTVAFDNTALIPGTIAFDSTRILDEHAQTIVGTDIAQSDDDESSVMTLDNTLEQVFFRECDQHMLSLRKSVNDALSSNHWDSDAQRAALNLSTQKAGIESADIATSVALPNRDMLRALHTLTGSAQTVDAQGIIAVAQPLQKAALQKQRNGESFNRAETEYIGEVLEILQGRLDAMEANRVFNDDDTAVMARLQEFVARSEPWVPERKGDLQLGAQLNDDVSVKESNSIESVFEQEARELLESLRVQSHRLSDDEQRSDAIDQILNRLHTIKGSARMAGQLALAERAHELEDEVRLADGVALDEAVFNGLGELQTLMLVDAPAETAVEMQAAPVSEPMGLTESTFENMVSLATRASISQAKLGESMLRLREACRDIETSSARLQGIPHAHEEINSAALAEMLNDLDSAQRMLADALLDAEAEQTSGARADAALHQTLIRAQLVNFSESQVRLQHAAADAARETGKQIDFQLIGGELTVDKTIYRKLITPLEHLVRNAVVHGIEAAAERGASGKSANGQVSVDAKIDGTDLLITVSDDGVGLNPKALLGSSIAKQSRLQKARTLSAENMLDILCEPGFTTHENADQLGGRGLGLSSVKQLVDELDGSLQLDLPEHTGCVFSLRIPQKTRINQIVLVEQGAQLYAIPVNFVHTISDEQADLSNADIQFNGTDYTCCALDSIINGDISGNTASNHSSSSNRVILVGIHDKHIALMVDKVLGYREVIAQPLGPQFANLKRYLGGSVLADGRAVLIPDFNRLLSPESVLPVSNWSSANEAVISRTALVIDDSITMRVAAEQMLQMLSIEPRLARDGAEAVEMIGNNLPDVFLVDIDMPRMNGFDFLQHLRVLHPEHNIPIIMISTRDTEEDRQQAQSLGAQQYLVKPYTESQLRAALDNVGMLPDGVRR